MPTTLQIDTRKYTTFESAIDTDRNIISTVAHFEAATKLYDSLWEQKETIEALAKHHLKLTDQDTCTVVERHLWRRGSFNVCIPILARSKLGRKILMLRCPLPHKLAEAKYPGTMDEKLSAEVGTYAWMQSQCPDVRIPFLYGFGFSDHRHFVRELPKNPFYLRLWRTFQRRLHNLLRYLAPSYYTAQPTSKPLPTAYPTNQPFPTKYVPHPTNLRLSTPYMLIEYLTPKKGQMLSITWEEHRNDPVRRQNLFRGMSRLMISLARIPQPRIGSFEFHNNGTITLTNRPMPCPAVNLENEGAQRTIQRNETYTCTEPFVADMITLYDNIFLSNPNAVYDANDCRSQMAAGALCRMLSHHYIERERRNGPFYLQLTDFHQSNILVDENWNITCLIDLEWVCALPAEMLNVPYWLTDQAINHIRDDKLREFDEVRQEFMKIFEEEEVRMVSKPALAGIMHDNWESGRVWFWYALSSINLLPSLVEHHLCPRFSRLSFEAEEILSQYWCQDSAKCVERKVTEFEGYKKDLEVLFSKQAEDNSS